MVPQPPAPPYPIHRPAGRRRFGHSRRHPAGRTERQRRGDRLGSQIQGSARPLARLGKEGQGQQGRRRRAGKAQGIPNERDREGREAQVAAYKAKEQQAEWKAQVSAKTGIPAEALRGSTLEEIQAHADILNPLVHPAPKLSNVPNPAQHPEGKTADERAKAYVRSLFGNKD